MLDEEFVHDFIDEAHEALLNWERVCLSLQEAPSLTALDELFRYAHNIKGTSKIVGLNDFGDFVHEVEHLITSLRSEKIEMSKRVIDLLLQCQSFLISWLMGLKEDLNYTKDEEEVAKLDQLLGSAIVNSLPTDSTEDPTDPPRLGDLLVDSGKITEKQLEDAIQIQNRKIGEIMISEGIVSEEVVEDTIQQQKETSGFKAKDNLRVPSEKIDKLIQIIGQFSIQHSMVYHSMKVNQLETPSSHQAISQGHKLIKESQTLALSLRMQTLKNLFQRLQRVARDISSTQSKPLTISISGGDTDLDKSIIETVADPLVHIVRNAIDHGIESKKERTQLGKSEKASLTISAQHDAFGVVIVVGDDGRGLDQEKLLKKALQKKLISPNAKLSENEIFNLIFEPGFSTVEQVTDLSGRGVGMDVVKKAIDSVGGTISIQSTQGQGTFFTIHLPTSVSIIDTLVTQIDNDRYLVPMGDLDEILDIAEFTIEKANKTSDMFNLRGEVVPIESMKNFFPHRSGDSEVSTGGSPATHQKRKPALIVKNQGKRIAFLVDHILGQQQVVTRPLNKQLSSLPGYSCSTVLADGGPGMIVALKQIASQVLERHE